MLTAWGRLSRRVKVLSVAAVLVAVGAAPAWAYWSAQQTVPAQTVALGTIRIAGVRSGSAGFDASALYPGASLAQVYQVSNAGTLPLSFYATGWATGPLGSALAIRVTNASTVTGTFPAATCGGTQLAPSATSLPTASPGTPIAYATQSAGRTVIWPSAGPSPTSSTICVQVTLPTTAANALQSQTTSVNVRFTGEQVGRP